MQLSREVKSFVLPFLLRICELSHVQRVYRIALTTLLF